MNLCTTCKYHVFGAMVPIPTGKPDEPPVMTAMGWCYRYPPQVTGQGMSSSPPVKSETTWCGEYRENLAAKLEPKMKALRLRCTPMKYDQVAKAMNITTHSAAALAATACSWLAKQPLHPEFGLVAEYKTLKKSANFSHSEIDWRTAGGTIYQEEEETDA